VTDNKHKRFKQHGKFLRKQNKKGRQRTFVRISVTVTHVRVNIVTMDKKCVLHNSRACVCVVHVDLVIKHAKGMRRIVFVICGLHGSTIFLHLSHTGYYLKKSTEHRESVLIFCTKFARNIYFSNKNWTT